MMGQKFLFIIHNRSFCHAILKLSLKILPGGSTVTSLLNNKSGWILKLGAFYPYRDQHVRAIHMEGLILIAALLGSSFVQSSITIIA